jgi:hypothetical protein
MITVIYTYFATKVTTILTLLFKRNIMIMVPTFFSDMSFRPRKHAEVGPTLAWVGIVMVRAQTLSQCWFMVGTVPTIILWVAWCQPNHYMPTIYQGWLKVTMQVMDRCQNGHGQHANISPTYWPVPILAKYQNAVVRLSVVCSLSEWQTSAQLLHGDHLPMLVKGHNAVVRLKLLWISKLLK